MSSKKGDFNLFIPGADGWEIWTGTSENGFQLHEATEHRLALEVTGFKSGPVMMAIPVRQVSAVPFRAQTDDLSLLGDLSSMQLEKNGTRPALDGGQLTDHFVYGMAKEETHLTAVVMTPPGEGQLPQRSPQAFDISPRCLTLPENTVVVWKELGRWVFAIGKPGHALYFQCLSGDRLDNRAGNEIRLAMTQLQIQGMLATFPERTLVWSHGSASDARPEELETLSRGLEMPVESSPRPDPVWPKPPSRLLPADVRAERMAGKVRRTRQAAIAAALIVYLGLVGYLFFSLRKTEKEARDLGRKADQMAGEARVIAEHEAMWDELQPVVEAEFHPLEVLLAAQRALPNSPGNRVIRLKQAVVTNQFQNIEGEMRVARNIRLEGMVDEQNNLKIPEFSRELKDSEGLGAFRWSFGPERRDRKTGKLTFEYEASATR